MSKLMGKTSETMSKLMGKKTTNEIQQLYAYTEIINNTLNNEKPIVVDILKDLQDGLILTRYLQIETGKTIQNIIKTPLTKQDQQKNLETILSFIQSENIKTTVSVNDLLSGDSKAIIYLMFYLVYRFRLNDTPVRIVDFAKWIKCILKINNPLFDLKSEFCEGCL